MGPVFWGERTNGKCHKAFTQRSQQTDDDEIVVASFMNDINKDKKYVYHGT